ncbi:chemotaxis protein CheD [Pseudoduganella sp. OTU4001]|uniref:chemotaxis protein CheD n=1 Tax=Pseudoduganella sp. OTU4001 TaxID=3043854 RepID=UPI00313DCF75
MSDKMVDIFLLPGDYFVGDGQHRVRTVVGSCVAVTLWHPRMKVGAMAHFLLPGDKRRRANPAAAATYGADAVPLLVKGLEQLQIPVRQCQAKVFGGGAMFGDLMRGSDVGRKNGDCARDLLQQHGITVVSESLYGEGHRQVIFNVRTGEVLCRQMHPDMVPALPARALV